MCIRDRSRRAIVAVPPPLAARIELDPAVPPRRDQLVHRHAMGAVVKLVVVYERPFWRESGERAVRGAGRGLGASLLVRALGARGDLLADRVAGEGARLARAARE